MNVKKAKALRKIAGFHPTDVRKYENQVIYSSLGQVRSNPRTKVNSEKTTRAIYQQLKRLSSN